MLLYKAHGLAVGDYESVGVRHFASTDQHPPLRVFYPSNNVNLIRPVGWFQEDGLGFFLSGYLHAIFVRRHTKLFRWLLSPLLQAASFFLLTMRWIRIPNVALNAPVANNNNNNNNNNLQSQNKWPVVIFSHGLTGTGQENAVLLSAWARRGFVVVSVHHTDGSACRVRLSDGSDKFYEHGPSFSNYDPSFRKQQIQHRAKEMKDALSFLQSNKCPQDIRDSVDPTRAVAAGFSYGAATAALATSTDDQPFCGAILLDGWLYIDVSRSAGIEFEFPEPAFQSGLKVPSVFINSQSFSETSKLYQATKKLANMSRHNGELHVLPGTSHQNFCDVIFWLPKFLLKPLIGTAHPVDTYREIVHLSSEFLTRVVVLAARADK
jgi:predicted esterase